MTVYLIRGNCGDYYCGCGGGHVIGVYSSRESAEHGLEQAKEQKIHYGDPEKARTCWYEFDLAIQELSLDAPIKPVIHYTEAA